MSAPAIYSSHIQPLLTSLALLSCGTLLVSCGTSASNLAGKSLDSIKSATANLLPSRIPIAEVRTKDLQKLTSGTDRALAWDRKLNRWVYMAVDYKPATLPDQPSLPVDGGLLPALHPGQNTTLKSQGSLPGE